MGKWTKLKDKLTRFVEEPAYQQRIDRTKELFQALSRPDRLKTYAKLLTEKHEVEDKLADVNLRQAALTQLLVDDLETSNELKVTNLLGTFFLKDAPYPKVVDQPALIAWVRDESMEELLSLNYQTMAGMCKSRLEKGEALMPGVEVFMKTSIGFTPAR